MPQKARPGELLALVRAVRTIQRFARSRLQPKNPAPEALPDQDGQTRRQLIKKFILHFERAEREPITNVSQEERSRHFQAYCATLVQRAGRARLHRRRVQLRVYPVYALAAAAIARSLVSRGRLWAAKRLQRAARSRASRGRFLLLKEKIAALADPQITNPAELLRLLDRRGAEVLESLGAAFALRFRLCGAEARGVAAAPPGVLGAVSRPRNAYAPCICYKVFVRQHVVDLGETAPRNYAVERLTGVADRRLWYARFANQPWRRLDGRALGVQEPRPALRPAELRYLKECKREQWRRRVARDWACRSAAPGAMETLDAAEEGLGGALGAFLRDLDYKSYENEWRDYATNVFSLGFVREQIEAAAGDEAMRLQNSFQ